MASGSKRLLKVLTSRTVLIYNSFYVNIFSFFPASYSLSGKLSPLWSISIDYVR